MDETVRITKTRIILGTLVFLLVGATVVGWQAVYSRPTVAAVVVVLGGALGVLLAFGGRRLRLPWPAGVVASLVVATGLSLTGDPRGYASVGSAVLGGWKELATTGLLVGSTPALLFPPAFVSVLGAFGATWLVWRSPTRSLGAGVALVPSVGAYAYTVDVARFPFWMAGLLTALVGLILLADQGGLPDGVDFADAGLGAAHRRRALAAGGAVVAAVSLLAVALVFPLRAGERADHPFSLRSWISRPIHNVEDTSPLAMVKSQKVAANPSIVFEIRVDGLSADEEIGLIPVAILDDYDGAVFSTRGGFTPAGERLPGPAEPRSESNASPLTQTVTLAPAYPFRVLPVAGELIEVATPGLVWNRGTRTLASLESLESFTVGLELTGHDLTPEDSLGEPPASVGHATELPSSAPNQLRVMDRFVGPLLDGSEIGPESILAITAALRSKDFGYNENAPGGHSLAAIANYLGSEPGEAGSRVGFSEQSAATLAVAARRVGVPARVVVGYRLPMPLTPSEPRAVVTEDMAHAWVEVWTAGGWARLDPTNTDNAVSTLVKREPTVAEEEEGAAPAVPEALEPPLLDPGLMGSQPRSILPWLVALAALAVVGLLVAVVVAKRIRRSRRRRAADPSIRAIGARRELADGLIDLGIATESSETLIDLADRFETLDLDASAEALTRMAPVLDRALYSVDGATPQGADEAWEDMSVVLAEASGVASPTKRITRPVNPVTLVRRGAGFR